MTNQTLVNNPAASSTSGFTSRTLNAMKSTYQLDQQVKLLHLHAETESLLQQLKAIKQQRQASLALLDDSDVDRHQEALVKS